MDMDESWNPEPPPEIMKINKEDLIGDTLFSKHWLFEVLLKLIKKVEEDASSSEPKDEGEAAANYEELDPDFEKDLCDLWDMSVQKDVVLVLDEFNAIQIFEGFLLKFNDKYPRAIEILIGILVNMATLSSEIALKLINNQWLMHFLLFEIMVKMADVPSVIQVVFLLTVFTRTETRIQSAFFEAFKTELSAKEAEQPGPGGNVGLLQTFYFILEQSLNSTLLDSTCNLIVQLIDNDEQLLDAFSSDARIVDSVCAAVQTRFELERSQRTQPILETPSTVRPSNLNRDEPVNKLNTQTSQEDISTIDHVFNKYFLCLQTLSTCERGAECLLSRADAVLVRTFDVYLENCLGTFNEWEIKSSHSLKSSVVAESLQNLVCLISLLNCLIPDQLDDTQARLVDLNLKYPTFFEKLFHLCKYYLIMFSEVKQIDSQESQNGNNNNSNSAAQSNSNTDDVDSNSQFNMAHTSLKDLLKNVLILKKQNNPKLSRLIDECISLSDDVEHQ